MGQKVILATEDTGYIVNTALRNPTKHRAIIINDDGSMVDQNGLSLGGAIGPAASLTAQQVASLIAIIPPAPVINAPTIIGTASTYVADGTVLSQQWTLNGADVAGATGPTYTQALADSGKPLRVRQVKPNGVSGTSLGTLPGMRNWKQSNTTNLRAMLAGGIRGRIIGWGDSYNAGQDSGSTVQDGSVTFANARQNGWIPRIAGLLSTAGVPARFDSTFGAAGMCNTAADLASCDPRITTVGAPTFLGGYPMFGGSSLGLGSGNSITFTPGGTFTVVGLIYAKTVAAGSFNVLLNGSGTVFQTVNFGGATATPGYLEIAVPGGTTSVTVAGNVSNAFLAAIHTRTAATPTIEVYNPSVSGVSLAVLGADPTSSAMQAYNTRAAFPLFCDQGVKNVFIINGWYNDRAQGYTQAQTQAQLVTMANFAKAYGDVIYAGYTTLASGNAWQQAMEDTAVNTLDIPVMDTAQIITAYTGNESLYGDNGLHLGATGHPIPAAAMAAQMLLMKTGN